jgi:carbon-monoxide dehydrogenase small subunit
MLLYSDFTKIDLKVNEEVKTVVVRPADTLLSVLRNGLGLTGAKNGCENGDCGACTVLVDDLPVKSCLMLAVEAQGKDIITVEGLKETALQEAFIKEGGFQCGFCTSGFLLNAYGLLRKHQDPSDDEIRTWLESNLCRCTGYEGIERAVKRAIKEGET